MSAPTPDAANGREFGSPEWALYLLAHFESGHPGIDWYEVAQALARRVHELADEVHQANAVLREFS